MRSFPEPLCRQTRPTRSAPASSELWLREPLRLHWSHAVWPRRQRPCVRWPSLAPGGPGGEPVIRADRRRALPPHPERWALPTNAPGALTGPLCSRISLPSCTFFLFFFFTLAYIFITLRKKTYIEKNATDSLSIALLRAPRPQAGSSFLLPGGVTAAPRSPWPLLSQPHGGAAGSPWPSGRRSPSGGVAAQPSVTLGAAAACGWRSALSDPLIGGTSAPNGCVAASEPVAVLRACSWSRSPGLGRPCGSRRFGGDPLSSCDGVAAVHPQDGPPPRRGPPGASFHRLDSRSPGGVAASTPPPLHPRTAPTPEPTTEPPSVKRHTGLPSPCSRESRSENCVLTR